MNLEILMHLSMYFFMPTTNHASSPMKLFKIIMNSNILNKVKYLLRVSHMHL